MVARSQQGLTDSLPLKLGAIYGAGSFVAGYIVTLAIVMITESGEFTDDLIEFSGWLYYNAQFANVEISVTGDDAGFAALLDGSTFNYLTDNEIFSEPISMATPSIVYHLIPVVALVFFGFILAQKVGVRTPRDGAIAGATLCLGVLPLALLGTFIFSIQEDSLELAPILSDSLIFVGILFPLVFGAIGGALSTRK